jgi:transcriptional regulator GlxA family with amidase domain
MIRVLIDCIYTGAEDRSAKTLARHIAIMSALEDALTANIERDLALPELFDTVGVPERTLRLYCNLFLGMGPRRYLQLRRLNRVRAELQNADPETTLVAQIAQRYRFSELGRFAAAYRAVFDETPSETLRRKRQGHDFGFAANA